MIDFYHDRPHDVKNRLAFSFSKKSWDLTAATKGGTTFAVEKLNSNTLLNVVVGGTIHIKFGVARCNKTDNFNKKIGRELAEKRMVITKFEVTKMIVEKEQLTLFLSNDQYSVQLMFKQNKQFSRLVEVS